MKSQLSPEEKRLQLIDQRILPKELKPSSRIRRIWVRFSGYPKRLFGYKKYKIHGNIRPLGAPTYDPLEGRMTGEEPDPEAYSRLVRLRSEVITPTLEDTTLSLAGKVSQAACDREYARIIVYPITGEDRVEVLGLVADNPTNFPMYEYRPANIVNDDNLDANTIIYKYAGKTHICKPV